jgi:MFS family permease
VNQGDHSDEFEREPMTPSTGPFPDVSVDPLFERVVPEHDPYGVLRNPDYRRFLCSGMMATIGGQMQGVAVGWELYERTGSATALGLVGLAQVLPVILLAIPAGHAADHFNRKHQVIVSHVLLFLASIGLALISSFRGPVELMYVCLVLIGIGLAVNMPARWSIMPQIVARHEVARAVTWNSSSWQVAAMVGPSLGGLVIALTHGATTAYALDAVCSVVVVILIAPIRLNRQERVPEPVSLESLLAGLRFVFSTELILATITLDLFAVLLGGATALLPIYSKDILQIGPTGLGWLRAAPSIGAFMMAFLQAHRRPMRRAGPALIWAVIGFGLATIVFGLSRNPYLSFVMLLLTGAFDNISVVVRSTLIQLLTPDAMRGRVSAVNAIFIGCSNELGEFESGIAARLLGPVASVVAGGVGTIVVVLAVAITWPTLLRLGPLRAAGRVEEAG